jgi:hypothetical protein
MVRKKTKIIMKWGTRILSDPNASPANIWAKMLSKTKKTKAIKERMKYLT